MPDFAQRTIGLLLAIGTLPLVLALAFAIRLDSPGPVLYRAARVGPGGRIFECLKLRSMAWTPDRSGPGVTLAGDTRRTRLGRILRRTHLDEVPQLWNVARGEMRLVGPRPEDPRYVDLSDPLHRSVFLATPGITGLAQLVFANEGLLIDPADPDRSYRESLLPQKLRLDQFYLSHRSTQLDLWILAQTGRVLLGSAPPTLAELKELR
jgi:lipopolysaccharide/colanic/teichoic acid biosynthesis glycosyltransferase